MPPNKPRLIRSNLGRKSRSMLRSLVALTLIVTVIGDFCTDYKSICGKEYKDCKTAFANLPVGDPSKTGNTQACRIAQLALAQSGAKDAVATHCPHASENGGGPCVVPTKDTFCANYKLVCGKEYKNCATDFPKLDIGDSSSTGATQACRIFHLELAQRGSHIKFHCPHASETGGGQCVAPRKGTFCEEYKLVCGKEYSKNCATDFPKLDVGDASNTGNTQACRIKHLTLAQSGAKDAAKVHCPHASETGSAVCVAPTKDTFCTDYNNVCGKEYKDCATAFPKLDVGRNTKFGNTQSCRLGHLALAQSGAATSQNCARASETGGDECMPLVLEHNEPEDTDTSKLEISTFLPTSLNGVVPLIVVMVTMI